MDLSRQIGKLPYRMALAGGWIDQPFLSRHNPKPPGSMVVASLVPTVRFMDRSGMATGTRKVAQRVWGDAFPDRPREALVRELYAEENKSKVDPSGSQDMIGLIYPGISRLDYDFDHEGGVFPSHIESTSDPKIVAWLESVIHVVTIAPRPPGYHPLGVKNIDPKLVHELGESGRNCFDAILARDVKALGHSFNEGVRCYSQLLPHTLRHPTLNAFDYVKLQEYYQQAYAGAMYSGCGGGYIYVVSEERVPGSFQLKIRTENSNL